MSNKPDVASLAAELVAGVQAISTDVVAHFVEQMPEAYFQDTSLAVQATHVAAVLGARASRVPVALTLVSPDHSTWTFIHEDNHPGQLAELVRQLPADRELRSAKVHTARDGSLVLDVFRFGGDDVAPVDGAAVRKILEQAGAGEDAGFREHLASCSPEYLASVTPWRALQRHRDLSGLGAKVRLAAQEHQEELARLTLTTASRDPGALFRRVVDYVGHVGLDIRRAYLDRFGSKDGGTACAVTLLIARDPLDPLSMPAIDRDLERLEWLDQAVLDFFYASDGSSLGDAELLVALIHLVHTALAREDSHGFARSRLYRIAAQHGVICQGLISLIQGRFGSGELLKDGDFDARRDRLAAELRESTDDQYALGLFRKLFEAAGRLQRTNAFVPQRLGLSFRFDPALIPPVERGESPFGAFFVHGRSFDGFHVRFRDVARGGVRVVLPRSLDQYTAEADRIYDEAYDLAFAQQLKNKDIPEGGSKAVVLVRPGGPGDLAFRAFADSLLDLLCPSGPGQSPLVDLWGRPEVLYLGPDENVSPELIDWLVERARRRQYPMPDAFISSKPAAGINHKQYGVTSEGVTVFLEEALKFAGIDPRRQGFSVKLTGGPDGDVAGNEIRILQREFRGNARIVCISDGSGFARDPAGLDMAELIDLVDRSLPIVNFSPAKLSAEGEIVSVEEPGGLRRRNGIHNDVEADAFVPAGGRPQTIHRYNWEDFLREGRPTARVIVEGANLFITPEARGALSAAGVVIVKDSSANKTGVICSSYEIVASMLLSPEEFLAIKERFVSEVLDRLRRLARKEAKLLFREKRRFPDVPLPELSVRISRHVIAIADAIEGAFEQLSGPDLELLSQLVYEHIPDVLLELGRERVLERIPRSYRASIVSSSLASRIVYREGLGYVPEADSTRMAQVALRYLKNDREVDALVEVVRASGMSESERIVDLLRAGGPRAALDPE